MQRFLFAFILGMLSSTIIAQIPNNYYNSAQGLNGPDLKTALFHIIKDHNTQSYSSIWGHFYVTDKKPNGKVWDMYSDIPDGTPPYQYTFGENQCGTFTQEGSCYNREHSFPKSWFGGKKKPMFTDLFQVIPSDGYVNSRRNNFPYGEVNNPIWTFENGSKLGYNSTAGYSDKVFEPIDEYKGDLARIYFYMATRYEDKIADWENNTTQSDAVLDGSRFPCYEEWMLDILLAWHQNDPVSQKEIDRNNQIYHIQNNRNPYVDHPEYVNMVWGGSIAPTIANISWTPEFPNENIAVQVQATITDDGNIASAELHYGFSSTSLNQQLNMTLNNNYYNATIPGQAAGQIVYFRILATDNEGNTTQSGLYHYQVTENPGTLALPFTEDFNDETLGIFIQKSISGSEQFWHNHNYNDSYHAKMSNYNGSENIENEDWLMTPAINFNNYTNEVLQFESAMKNYNDNSTVLSLKYSSDYNGSGNPNNATWIDITEEAQWSQGNYEWVASGNISLNNIEGEQVYIAFVYNSQAGSGKTWQLDNISITAEQSTNTAPVIGNIAHSPDSPTNHDNVTISAEITDDSAIDAADLVWGNTASQMHNTVSMQNAASTFTGVIPAQTTDTVVFYKIVAVDDEGISSTSPTYSYTIKNDDAIQAWHLQTFQVFPNPCTDIITIKSKKEEKITIHITDISGRLVQTIPNHSTNTIVNMQDLTPGIYYLQISNTAYIQRASIIKL